MSLLTGLLGRDECQVGSLGCLCVEIGCGIVACIK